MNVMVSRFGTTLRTTPRFRPAGPRLGGLPHVGNGNRSLHDCLVLMSEDEWRMWRESGRRPSH